MRLIVRIALLAVGFLIATATPSAAYPQFQLMFDVDRCLACHYSPSGGGLLNDYGRDEGATTIGRGGDGRFLHGLWEPPSWLALGADVRLAGLAKRQLGETELLGFPMQTDLYARFANDHLSVNVTAGLRGGARDPQPRLVERLASREHYVMYQSDAGAYVRAGRFTPVFGVRSQDHTAFVRRYLGQGTLEEPYGIAGGWYGDTWDAHTSVFVPRPIEFLGAGTLARGVTLYAERRFADGTFALAGQARGAFGPDDTRLLVGTVMRRWFSDAKVLLLGELDVQRQSFDVGPTRYQLAGYLGASTFLTRGVMLGAGLHRWQPDLRARTSRDAIELNVQVFPRAHVELHLIGRIAGAGDFDDPSTLAMLQLHYYL